MSIGLVLSSEAVDGVGLAVDLHITRTDMRSTHVCVPDALMIINAVVDEVLPADVEEDILSGYSHTGSGWSPLEASEILRGHSDRGTAWSPVEMLIADRYLDRHPGLRMGFFAEAPAHPRQAERERAIGNRTGTGTGTRYVYKRLAFERCCQVVRTMGLVWPLDRSAPTHA